MYAPADPHHPDLAQRLMRASEQSRPANANAYPGTALYALIDATLDKTWALQIWRASQSQPDRIQALYQDTALAELQEYSPFVCAIAHHELAALLARSQALPMLSFMESSLGLTELREHLARFARARTPDGLWFPVRWGFALGVPELLAALSAAQHALLHSGFAAWHLINRAGGLETRAGTDNARGGAQGAGGAAESGAVAGMLEGGFALSEQAFARLVDAGEADAWLIAIGKELPAALGGRTSSVLHTMATSLLRQMSQLGILAPQKRWRLLIEALNQPTAQDARAWLNAHRTHRA